LPKRTMKGNQGLPGFTSTAQKGKKKAMPNPKKPLFGSMEGSQKTGAKRLLLLVSQEVGGGGKSVGGNLPNIGWQRERAFGGGHGVYTRLGNRESDGEADRGGENCRSGQPLSSREKRAYGGRGQEKRKKG